MSRRPDHSSIGQELLATHTERASIPPWHNHLTTPQRESEYPPCHTAS